MTLRVSMWQQFSSNHSASFTVVGEFADPAAAQKAAGEIRRLLAGIGSYYENLEHNKESISTLESGEPLPLTEIEQEFAAKYGISPDDWTWTYSGIDWIRSSGEANQAVHTFESLLFVANTGETWLGPNPFDALVDKMGGKVSISVEGGYGLRLDLHCSAPDEATIEAIEDAILSTSRLPYGADIPAGGFPKMLQEAAISRDGLRITLVGAVFARNEWDGLAMMVEALRARGCTQIEYAYIEPEDG